MKHPSSWIWFRYAARDLGPASWLALRWHVLRCSACAARLTREQAQLAAAPAPPPLAGIPVEPRRIGGGRRWWRWPALSSAVVVALGLVVFLRSGELRLGDDLRAKGASRFDLWVKGPPPHLLGTECHAGEQVQPTVSSAHRYLIVVHVDPGGQQRIIFPLGGAHSLRVPASLPQSWIFDGEPGTERFVALLSEAPLRASEALQLSGDRVVPPGVERIERSCRKVAGDAR